MAVTERRRNNSPVWALLRSLLFLAAMHHWPAKAAAACRTSAECRGREICLEQVCTCPVLYKGPGCKAPRPPVSKGCLIPFAEWPKKGYNPRGIDFRRCAVVGSSGILKGSKHGKTVDAATAVFRFNEAPTKGHEKDVGIWTKATIRMQNKERGGFAEKAGERCVVWSTNDYSKKVSGKGCAVTTMGKALEEYVGTYFAKYSGGKRKKGAAPISNQMAKMSNGFLGIVFALHLCARVDILGFDQGEGYYFKKFVGVPKGWGAPKSIKPSTRPFKERHSWDRERACVAALGAQLPSVTVHRKGYRKPLRPFIPEPANPAAAEAAEQGSNETVTSAGRFGRPASVAVLRSQAEQEQEEHQYDVGGNEAEAAGANEQHQQHHGGVTRPSWHVKRWRDSLAAARSAGDSVVQTGPRQVTKLGSSRPRARAAVDGSAAGAAPQQDGSGDANNVATMLHTLSS